MGSGIPLGERGRRRSDQRFPGLAAGVVEKIRHTVTFRGALSFYVFQDRVPAAVNVGDSPGFAVFCFTEKEKGNDQT